MTPAEAAREVAARAESRAYDSCSDESTKDANYAVWEAFAYFAELLDREPPPTFEIRTFGGVEVRKVPNGPCGWSCPDGIACPLEEDDPAAHRR